ncbi:MAG: ABC transporter substrate-binding protein, partial [Myxococcota bacterium]
MIRALLAGAFVLVAASSLRADSSREVYVGVYLHDVTRLILKDGMVDVDFDLWAKWRGEFDHEQLQVANAATLERHFLGEESDRDWHTARWRVRGTLRGEFPMTRFPYDEQIVAVELELPTQLGRLVPDAAGSGMESRFSLTDWLYDPEFEARSEEREVSSDLGLLEREGLPSTVRKVAYRVRLRRPIVTVALKLFLPLAIIALVALVALFLPGSAIEPRSGIGVTALLSCFAFQFTISDTLPSVAYLTLADTLFLIAYVLSTCALIVTIASHSLTRTDRAAQSARLDRTMRVLLPTVAAIAVAVAIPGDLPPREPEIDPLPDLGTATSSRDELHIGTNILSNITGTPVFAGGYWQLLEAPPDEHPQPVFVQRRPGIDNEMVRFLADGRLEVTWKLREGLKWSDGTPLVARDLTLPWDAYDLAHVVGYEAPDDRTLVVTWDGRLAMALETPVAWPSHVLDDAFQNAEEGEGYGAVRELRRTTPTPSLGPYVVTEYVPNERVVAEANPEFLGEPPAIRRVVVHK